MTRTPTITLAVLVLSRSVALAGAAAGARFAGSPAPTMLRLPAGGWGGIGAVLSVSAGIPLPSLETGLPILPALPAGVSAAIERDTHPRASVLPVLGRASRGASPLAEILPKTTLPAPAMPPADPPDLRMPEAAQGTVSAALRPAAAAVSRDTGRLAPVADAREAPSASAIVFDGGRLIGPAWTTLGPAAVGLTAGKAIPLASRRFEPAAEGGRPQDAIERPPAATGTHSHPKATGRPSFRSRLSVLWGFGLLIAGAAMMVLPGPGTLLLLAGLSVLSRHFPWAQRTISLIRQAWTALKRKVRTQD